MTDEQIIKALECCIHKGGIINCEPCPVGKEFGYQMCEHILILQCNGLINRQNAEIERLQQYREKVCMDCEELMYRENKQMKAEIERLQHYKQSYDELKAEHLELIRSIKTCRIEAIKEFAEKITEVFLRYAHLHTYAEKSRTETIESAEGEKIEMQSVWDVLSLKKYEMAEYEEMSELQINIEIIAKERLLTELEKDFRLLKKEIVGDSE